jgi:shikimate dehydrogenase
MPQQTNVGLIGDPVSHSISPAMHNAAFAELKIAARYEAWPTPAAQLAARVGALRRPGMLGANVTLPHKQAVIPLLDTVDGQAAAIGAVNTIVRAPDGHLTGFNTDAPAVLETLREDAGFDPAGKSVVLLGASGAARAAAAALLGAGASQIAVVNRTLERAEELLADLIVATLPADAGTAPVLAAPDLPALLALVPNDPQTEAVLRAAALVVNATSLGWKGEAAPINTRLLAPGALVFDMVYRPTPLLREAEEQGARPLDGLGMLVRQGALAFRHWTGRHAPLDVMWEAARKALHG